MDDDSLQMISDNEITESPNAFNRKMDLMLHPNTKQQNAKTRF